MDQSKRQRADPRQVRLNQAKRHPPDSDTPPVDQSKRQRADPRQVCRNQAKRHPPDSDTPPVDQSKRQRADPRQVCRNQAKRHSTERRAPTTTRSVNSHRWRSGGCWQLALRRKHVRACLALRPVTCRISAASGALLCPRKGLSPPDQFVESLSAHLLFGSRRGHLY